jgi:hypothetical protein
MENEARTARLIDLFAQKRIALKRNDFSLIQYFALACCSSMIFSDLASPAEA